LLKSFEEMHHAHQIVIAGASARDSRHLHGAASNATRVMGRPESLDRHDHVHRVTHQIFFVGHGHVVIPSASLVPANDPTVLFTTAGMHPLVPYLLGEPHAAGARLVNAQRCVRTGDIDEIGDDTLFEMLGNWSLGDYFREEAIRWSFEFLTRVLNIPVERLGVTCFAGDAQVPRDDESVRLWRTLGVERIRLLGRDDNWWGPAGTTGPCDPDQRLLDRRRQYARRHQMRALRRPPRAIDRAAPGPLRDRARAGAVERRAPHQGGAQRSRRMKN
jgi:hypothetical protein